MRVKKDALALLLWCMSTSASGFVGVRPLVTVTQASSRCMAALGAGRATAVAAEDVVEAPWRLHPEHPAASHPKVAAIFQYLNQHPLVVGGQPMVSSMCLLP